MKKWYLVFLFEILISTSFSQNFLEKDARIMPDSLDEKVELLIDFSLLKPNQVVADIGSGKLFNILTIANKYPETIFYCEDIDSTKCSEEAYNEVIANHNYNNVKKANINIVIGTIESTTLPSSYFDVVYLISTLHEIDNKIMMIEEIKRILKPGGHFVLEDVFTRFEKKKHEACSNRFMTISEMDKLTPQLGMDLIKDWKITSYKEDGHYIDVHRRFMMFKKE